MLPKKKKILFWKCCWVWMGVSAPLLTTIHCPKIKENTPITIATTTPPQFTCVGRRFSCSRACWLASLVAVPSTDSGLPHFLTVELFLKVLPWPRVGPFHNLIPYFWPGPHLPIPSPLVLNQKFYPDIKIRHEN